MIHGYSQSTNHQESTINHQFTDLSSQMLGEGKDAQGHDHGTSSGTMSSLGGEPLGRRSNAMMNAVTKTAPLLCNVW